MLLDMCFGSDAVDELMAKYDDADNRRRVRVSAKKSARVKGDPRSKRGQR